MFAIRPITALDFVIYIGSRSARLRLRPRSSGAVGPMAMTPDAATPPAEEKP